MTVRVLLADDQTLIRAGFRALIDATEDLTVVGEAATGTEAVALTRSARPDVVLMDIRMPELDGLGATRQIAGDESLAGVRVVMLTTFEVDEYVLRALRAGASGFLGKGLQPRELCEAIRLVARGDALLSPKATRGLIARFLAQPDRTDSAVPELLEVLTEREREIVSLVASGLSNEEIAERLYLAQSTVKTHVKRAMAKLSARDRAQLVVIAYQTGLVAASG
ncbi:response regulator [Streptomyces boncukensis]|uniref:Response regulator transcription factor n=1 Tax=Streptomyces boncukensis TaxID=2711219 RepID=A0A6G4WXE0_9ACTN|nr:response regulator transcription factor [Streptomyces boncukensis]NGO69778.1 response regulator transcription factor [Streptomyces boncukensis]